MFFSSVSRYIVKIIRTKYFASNLQVCDLQVKIKYYTKENDDLSGSIHAYKEAQDELTTELADFKEKYREISDLLRDAQEELKRNRRRRAMYPGAGLHSVAGMFASAAATTVGTGAAGLDTDGNEEKGKLGLIILFQCPAIQLEAYCFLRFRPPRQVLATLKLKSMIRQVFGLYI